MEKIGVNIELIRQNFFMFFNNILSYTGDLCDLVQLQLHESYVLPTPTYATATIKLSETQIARLNACWNFVFRRIFHLTVVNRLCIMRDRSRLDFMDLRLQLSTKFYRNMQLYKHSVVREVCKTITLLKEFITFCILSKWSKKLDSLQLKVL